MLMLLDAFTRYVVGLSEMLVFRIDSQSKEYAYVKSIWGPVFWHHYSYEYAIVKH